jgi:YHS domain-containing protein
MSYEYIHTDLAGYPFNSKYPPNTEKYGSLYHGYRNSAEETFFYDFAVQRYDLRFSYQGKNYYFLSDEDAAALCDETFRHPLQLFKDGNDVLERFCINGVRLLDLIPQIKDVEAI